MSKAPRRNHSSAFKAKVALEALKGEQTVPEIAAKHNIHPTLVNSWKRALQDGASQIFEQVAGEKEKTQEALVGELYKQIGQQKVELDFFSTAARQMSRADKKSMIDPCHKSLSVSSPRQCYRRPGRARRGEASGRTLNRQSGPALPSGSTGPDHLRPDHLRH